MSRNRNLLIAGGRLVDPANNVEGIHDIYIRDGKVAALDKLPENFKVTHRIEASGLLVLPGLIDLCARLGTPGGAHNATIVGETRAAAGGGITRLVCPPDTCAVIDSPAMVAMLQDRAAAGGFTRVHPLAALTANLAGKRLTDMALLMDAGCIGVSNGLQPVTDALVMRRAMQYAATYDLPVFVTPRDANLHGNGVVHEGEISTRLGLPAIPYAAETVGVARDLALVESSGARAHFDLLSSQRAVEMIAEARARGLSVTAGVAIHHLHCNEQHIGVFDTRYKVLPPLRSAADQQALLSGVREGVIQAICSDHQPHHTDAKLVPFVEAAAGMSGLDTLLSLTMQLVQQGELPCATAVAALTANPAAIIGLDAGHLGCGAVADICLFDPKLDWCLDKSTMLSSGDNSPWLGCTLRGRVVTTLRAGEVVHQLASG